jgi:cobalt/nickel transport system permease protein
MKLLVAAPFALVVGLFNPIMDREPVATIGPLVLTGGWLSLSSLLFRFVLTVGAALTLVACTGMHRLGAGLEQLGCPRIFVVQLLFLHRYLFVVADAGVKMMRSVELRSTGVRPLPFGVYGSLIGHLLLRAMDRAGRIYQAMVARGFDGEIRVLHRTTFRATDWLFVLGCFTCFALARRWNLAEALGRLLTGGVT